MKDKPHPYGLREIKVTRFRNMHDLSIPLGNRITVLAGQNGTGKSTILGMIGQPFGLTEEKTIFGKSYATKFGDIFNLSPIHDVPGEHLYYLEFNDDTISKEKPLQVKSYVRTNAKSHIRFVAGATRQSGDGNIDYPVIYLGLRRTYPLGEFRDPKSHNPDLSESEMSKFINWYSQVIVPTKQTGFSPVGLKQDSRKNTFLINAEDYDYLANSAGQDNLGQIFAALLSFERLRKKMGESYKGGLLLIDELDVTLFPASQKRILDILYDVSPSLQLQTIFTTHSLSLIEYSRELQHSSTKDVSIAYLRNRERGVKAMVNPEMLDIECDLEIKPYPKAPQVKKVEIWCEDNEARWFINKMTSSSLKKKSEVVVSGLSCGELDTLALKKLSSLEDVIFVVDADASNSHRKGLSEHTRRIMLPGNNLSPEASILDMLHSLSDEDSFWNNESHYEKQTFLSRRLEAERNFKKNGGKKARILNRNWFNKEKASGVWGENGQRAYALWQSQYKDEIDIFCAKLEIAVDKIVRRRDGVAKVR